MATSCVQIAQDELKVECNVSETLEKCNNLTKIPDSAVFNIVHQ